LTGRGQVSHCRGAIDLSRRVSHEPLPLSDWHSSPCQPISYSSSSSSREAAGTGSWRLEPSCEKPFSLSAGLGGLGGDSPPPRARPGAPASGSRVMGNLSCVSCRRTREDKRVSSKFNCIVLYIGDCSASRLYCLTVCLSIHSYISTRRSANAGILQRKSR